VQSYGDDVQLDNSGNLTTSNANVTFAGTVNSQAGETNALSINAGIGTIAFNNAVGNSNALGNLSLTGDEINFGNTVTGTGDLIIQPSTPGLVIAIGGSDDPDSLDLTLAEIGLLQNGFNSITIGRSDGGNMTIAPAGATFNDPVTLQSQSAIVLNGNITGDDNASITLNGPTDLNAGNNTITTSGGDIAFNGTVNALDGTAPGSQNLTLNAGSGNITFGNAVGNTTALGILQGNSTGTTLFNSTVNATSLTTNAGGTTQLNGDVITNGVQSYGDRVQINSNISLTSNNNANLTFENIVDSEADEANALTITAGSGNITFDNTVGSTSNTALGVLQANSTGTTRFNSTVNSTALSTNAGGTTQLNGDVTTTGPAGQSYGDNVQINNSNITLTGDEINFTNPVTGIGVNLVLQPATPNQGILLGGTANSPDDTSLLNLTTAELLQLQDGFNSITIGRNDQGEIAIAPGDVTFRDPVILQSQSAIALNGSITGQDNASITLAGSTFLYGNDNTITTTGSNITFEGTLNGTSDNGQNLTLSAGSGNITFNSTVGNATPLGNLQVNSTGTRY
jgi:hypothetical protein